LALAFAVGCGNGNGNNDVVTPPNGPNGPNGPDITPERFVTELQILEQPAARAVHFEGQEPNLANVRVRLVWSDGGQETVTIGPTNRAQFLTSPRLVSNASAVAFLGPASDTNTLPFFTTTYTLLHATQQAAGPGQGLRLGIIRAIDFDAVDFASATDMNLRSPLFTGAITRPFYSDRILLSADDANGGIFAGLTVNVLYHEVRAFDRGETDWTPAIDGFHGPRINAGHAPVALSRWNLNEGVIDTTTEGYLQHTAPAFGGAGNPAGNLGPFFMGLQHTNESRGWMHVIIGEGASPTSITFPLAITLYPVQEIRVRNNTGNWSDHFQFMSSVPTTVANNTQARSDWWINEIFDTAGFVFDVLYGFTPTVNTLSWTEVQQARGRGFGNQIQLVGGVPNFFAAEVDGIVARVGWFSQTQLNEHANLEQAFPNQVVDLNIPVWTFDGEPAFVDRADQYHPATIVIEGHSTTTDGQLLPIGVIRQVRQVYDLTVQWSLTGNPRSPLQVPVNELFWNPGTAGAFFENATPLDGTRHLWSTLDRYNMGPEVEPLEGIGWTFPAAAASFTSAPFDAAPFIGSGARLRFDAPGEDGVRIRAAFAGLGLAEFPREALLLPFATMTP
jgi:hypothetical protein